MKRKLTAFMLTLILAFACSGNVCFATTDGENEDCVAVIGEVEYADLQKAFNDAKAGDTVQLVQNIECKSAESFTITSDITFDMGYNYITSDNAEDILTVSGCTASINNGEIVNRSQSIELEEEHGITAVLAENGANVKLNDMDLEIYVEKQTGFALNIVGNSQVTCSGGTIIDNNSTSALAASCLVDEGAKLTCKSSTSIYANTTAIFSLGTVSLTGAVVNEDFFNSDNSIEGNCDYAGIELDGSGKLTVNDTCVYGNPAVCLDSADAKATIKKGFVQAPDDYAALWNDHYKSYSKHFTVASGYVADSTSTSWKTQGDSWIAFAAKPAKTSISKLTRGKKAITVKWKKKSSPVCGYQIMLATNSKFTKNKKTVTVNGKTKYKKTIKNLKKGKKYYVKVRTFKREFVSGTKYIFYSDWSKVKTIRTK